MTTLSPKNANTLNKVCKLERDNYSCKGTWILTGDKEVTICNQFNGKPSTGMVRIPKKVFEQLINFYQKEQPISSTK